MITLFREQMTAWFAAHKEIATVNMLLHSKLLEMALNLANLATGTATARAYANLASWEAAGQKEVLGFRAREITVPDDLLQKLKDRPAAESFFRGLDAKNRYAILYRIHGAKKAETRARRIDKYVEMLERGEKIY